MLYDSIIANAQKIRFHTPGHGDLPTDLLKVDVTELPYSDNLAHPTKEIADLEKYLASAYGAEAAFFQRGQAFDGGARRGSDHIL